MVHVDPFCSTRRKWSVVGSGRISNSSKLLCMSSLPVSIEETMKTTEKKWQHRFSNYNTICCHGNQWSDLAEFRTHPSFYASPHCLQVSKGSDEKLRRKCDDLIFSIISLWDFFQTLKGSQLRSPWLDLAEFRTHLQLVAEIFKFENVYRQTDDSSTSIL